MDERIDLAAALAAAATALNVPSGVRDTLTAIAARATEVIPNAALAGITVRRGDRELQSLAATDDRVSELDELQARHAQGPTWEVFESSEPCEMRIGRDDERWAQVAPRAAQLGIASAMALRISLHGGPAMGLTLYATDAQPIDREVAELFAAHASLALQSAQQDDNLNAGLTGRTVIGQATGILMERFDLDEKAAFAYLARVSQDSNVKLRAVAEEVVGITERRNRSSGVA